MAKLIILYAALLVFTGCKSPSAVTGSTGANAINSLSAAEKKDGWKLLFDGQTMNGWHKYGGTVTGKAWQAVDGNLHLNAASKKDWQTQEGGDIVTADEFDNFHLKLDWKIATNGNSGIILFVQEDPAKYEYAWHTGPEMQVLDNAGHADAKIITHRAGDLYDLITAKETAKPANEWNQVEIISNHGLLQFFLNGEKTLETTMWDEGWKKLIAKSKFKTMPAFGIFKKGKISLQDHGDDVWYRNIKVKML